jgi:hypothetical protein
MRHKPSTIRGKGGEHAWRNYHLWLIISLFLVCVAVEYADFLGLFARLSIYSLLSESWYTAGRLLFLLAILYSTFIFRFNGGLIALSFALLAMFPQAIFSPPTNLAQHLKLCSSSWLALSCVSGREYESARGYDTDNLLRTWQLCRKS